MPAAKQCSAPGGRRAGSAAARAEKGGVTMMMKPRAAEQWIVRFNLFCQLRGRFWQLAFNTDATGRGLDGREEHRHGPAVFRALWGQALRQAGGGLTAAAALELMQLGSEGRRA